MNWLFDEDVKDAFFKIFLVVSVVSVVTFVPLRWRVDLEALDFAVTENAEDYVVIDKSLPHILPESYVIVVDTEGLDVQKFKETLDEKGAYLGLVEFQPSVEDVLEIEREREFKERFFRVHMIKKGEVEKLNLDFESTYMRYRRAVLERSVDLLWITNVPEGWKDEILKRLKGEFENHVVKRPKPHPGVPLVTWFFPMVLVILLLSYNPFLALISAIFLLLDYDIGVSVSSILSTIAVYRKFESPLSRFFGILLVGLLTNASLSDFYHLNQIYVFRGVKLSLIALPAFVLVKGLIQNREIFKKRSTFIFISVLVVLVGAYYLLRSGNFAPVSTFERKFRDLLEKVFWVRPRFKEMFGYPFLFFSNVFVGDFAFLIETIGAIALVSTFNTFCHIKAPIFVSLYRSFLGFALGFSIYVLFMLGGGERWSGSRSRRSIQRSAIFPAITIRPSAPSRRRRKKKRI